MRQIAGLIVILSVSLAIAQENNPFLKHWEKLNLDADTKIKLAELSKDFTQTRNKLAKEISAHQAKSSQLDRQITGIPTPVTNPAAKEKLDKLLELEKVSGKILKLKIKDKEEVDAKFISDSESLLTDTQKTKLSALLARDLLYPPYSKQKLSDEKLAKLLPILKEYLPGVAVLKKAHKETQERAIELVNTASFTKDPLQRRLIDRQRQVVAEEANRLFMLCQEAISELNEKIEISIKQ